MHDGLYLHSPSTASLPSMMAPASTAAFDRIMTVGQEALGDSSVPAAHRLIRLVG